MTARRFKGAKVDPAASARHEELAPLLALFDWDVAMFSEKNVVWAAPVFPWGSMSRKPLIAFSACRPDIVTVRLPDGRRKDCRTAAELAGELFRIATDSGRGWGIKTTQRRPGRPRKVSSLGGPKGAASS